MPTANLADASVVNWLIFLRRQMRYIVRYQFGASHVAAKSLLAEIGDRRARFESAEGLQAYAGTAPVTFQSSQIERHLVRRACQPFLRSALHLWTDRSRLKCAWAEAYYHAHRARGQSHACALRCLGQRWVKILWKMWQTNTLRRSPPS